jgi:hypothetical protein
MFAVEVGCNGSAAVEGLKVKFVAATTKTKPPRGATTLDVAAQRELPTPRSGLYRHSNANMVVQMGAFQRVIDF